MGMFKRLFGSFFTSTKIKVLLVGLDNSGKTTILNVMKPKKAPLQTIPTVGYTEETFTKNGICFSAVDMSGQGRYRNLWEHYYSDVEAIIFVVDSTDKLRLCVAKNELDLMLENASIKAGKAPLLIFANKMDCADAVPPLELMKSLGIDDVQERACKITPSDALHNEGIEPGIRWLVESVKKLRADAKSKAG